MSWLSKSLKRVTKLIPGWSIAGKTINALGDSLGISDNKNKSDAAPVAPVAPVAPLDITSLSDEEMTAEAQKRMAKLGKYFTSPLGVLSNASTGSQRTFS